MKRRVFYSFHYDSDNWRAAMVRNIGSIEGNSPASDNDWETVKKGGDAAIKRWIANQLNLRSCTVVLVGSNTANRKWINHEIIKSWDDGMGVVGIYVHGIKNSQGKNIDKGDQSFRFHHAWSHWKESLIYREVLQPYREQQPGSIRLDR